MNKRFYGTSIVREPPKTGREGSSMSLIRRAFRRLLRLRKQALGKVVGATAPLWQERPKCDLGPAVKTLRAEMQTAAPSSTTAEWSENCATLASCVAHNDPARFLQWPVILATMNEQGRDYIETEFSFLRADDWEKWKPVLQESSVGGIEPYWLYPRTSCNTVHHCYHLARFMKSTGISVNSFEKVFEYGGGYGNLCRITRALGVRCEYAITDLPQFIALQRFYLHGVGVDATLIPFSVCGSWLSKADLHNVLFIATWSFSESPIASRQIVAPFLPLFGALLIAFQSKFANIDNVAYFNELKDRMQATHQCTIVEIAHLPENFYFFARRC
jgi:hypothetical protein